MYVKKIMAKLPFLIEDLMFYYNFSSKIILNIQRNPFISKFIRFFINLSRNCDIVIYIKLDILLYLIFFIKFKYLIIK